MASVDAAGASTRMCRVLSLDGGGAKGFYTLGVLKEVEAMLGCRLHQKFDVIFGTSTGSIIAALISLGFSVDDVRQLYEEHVPKVMSKRTASARSKALKSLADEVFGGKTFADFKTRIGIVATRWHSERPMIFKRDLDQAHGRAGTFSPGFGVSVSDAVQASCSAFPFFDKKVVRTDQGHDVLLFDGGYCANNPTLYAIADATKSLGFAHSNIKVLSVGVGIYPEPKQRLVMRLAKRFLVSVELLQKTLEVNTQSMEQLREVLYGDIETVRVSDAFERPELATDLMERDLSKLDLLRQQGAESFASRESEISKLFN